MRRILSIFGIAVLVATSVFSAVPPKVAHAATTWVVNSTNDPGDGTCDSTECTLREAINAASSGDTISFDSSMSGQVINLKGSLSIGDDTQQKNLTIDASGLNYSVKLWGDRSSTILQILNHDEIINIYNLDFRYGSCETCNGGGINNVGTLNIWTSTISNNGAINGGGIYNSGTLNIQNSEILETSAELGGGIYNDGTLNIQNSEILETSAELGGGIYNDGTLTLTNVTMDQNYAYDNSNHSSGYGGGIYNSNSGTARITNGTFSTDRSRAHGGGGIYNQGNITVDQSYFYDNLVDVVTLYGSNGQKNYISGYGGGIYNINIATIRGCTFYENQVFGPSAYGAGLANFGNMTLINSTFSKNEINDWGNRNGEGSGIYNGTGNNNTGELVIINSTLANNIIDNNSDGDIYNYQSSIGLYNTIASSCYSNHGNVTASIHNIIMGNCGPNSSDDPMLESLADNGGTTPTFALQADSPAVDAGDDSTCASTDQRSIPRPQGNHCDIGAFELQQYTISGNASKAGTKFSYTDGIAKSTIADNNGDYSLWVTNGWSGTITPFKVGYYFTPATRSYSNVLSNLQNQNYVAPVAYQISGNVGIAGASLNFTDSSAKTVIADSAGNYSLWVASGWSGTITPSKAGYTFSPVNINYSSIQSDQTNQNYFTIPILYSISGNAGVVGAKMSYSDGSKKTVIADSSGNYSLNVPYNWSGSVTPSLGGYTFTPPQRSYHNVIADQPNQNYSVGNASETISGNVGVAGVTLSYWDGSKKTATSDSMGTYSISVSYNWSGNINPSKVGYVFSPTHRSYSHVTNTLTNQNYSALATTFTISGNTNVPGVILNYNDVTHKSVTSDSSGNYSLKVPAGWSGIITPTKLDINFNPAYHNYSNVHTNLSNQNFSISNKYTISGNTGLPGATLSYYDGGAKTIVADINGNYSLQIPDGWSGKITPALSGYTFTPTYRFYNSIHANQLNQNFVVSQTTQTISGNVGIAGVTLSFTDETNETTISNSNGDYSFTVPYDWSGTVIPTLAGYQFTPANLVYSHVVSDQIDQNYIPNATVTISGNATLNGVTLTYYDGSIKTTTTDNNGNYSFMVSIDWSGIVTPSKPGYTFSPVSRNYGNIENNKTNQDFNSTPILSIISGNVGVANATINYVDGTNKTTTADSSGNYSLTVSYNWSGTVTPTLYKDGLSYGFTPISKNYANIISDQIKQNYSATYDVVGIGVDIGVSNVSLSYTDGVSKTAMTNSNGGSSFWVERGWSGTVTPSKDGYVFYPMQRSYSNIQDIQNFGFKAFPACIISGNVGLAGVKITYYSFDTRSVVSDINGNYSFEAAADGQTGYSVFPSLTGYTFTPVYRVYTQNKNDQKFQNYTVTPITYTISGNTGIGGVTLTYFDGSTKSVTSDSSGNYSFTVLYNWSGVVSPSLNGYTFSPANRTYTNILADQSGQDYSTSGAHNISGNVGVARASLTYTDGTLRTMTADGNGNYSLPVSNGWSGTVTPSLSGYTFSPSNLSFSYVTTDQNGKNFSPTPITFTISGNAGVGNVTLNYTDGVQKSVNSDSSGNYSLTVSYNWSGSVTPSLVGYVFSPASTSFSNVLADQTGQNFTPTTSYTIFGNAGLPNVTLSYTDGSQKSVTSDGNGNYSFVIPSGWSGSLTPSLAGYAFSPANLNFSNVTADLPDQNFTPSAVIYTISGNAGASGVTLSYADGSDKTATSDTDGNYSFTVSYNWTGKVTPSLAGHGFIPANRTYTNVLSDQSSQNFTAVSEFNISGNTGVAGAILSYTNGSLLTAIADSSGNYTFTVPASWSGSVTPSLPGYTFSSTEIDYSNIQADQTGQDYTATQITFAISGNAGVGGAVLTYNFNGIQTVTSDTQGNYSFVVPYGWSGTLTPSIECVAIATPTKLKSGSIPKCHFSPTQKTFSNVQSDLPNQNFVFGFVQ
jgi:CSLREA domain-containing protein